MTNEEMDVLTKSNIELGEKLSIIQSKLKAPKSQFNSFGNYHYRNCEDILEAVKPYLKGLFIQLEDEIVMIGDRYYVKAKAVLSNGRVSISTVAYAREPLTKKGMDEAQITGATSTYARKYALNGLLAIDDTKDADSSKSEEKDPTDEWKSVDDVPSKPTIKPTIETKENVCPKHNAPMQLTKKGDRYYHSKKVGTTIIYCNGRGFADGT